RSGEIIYWPGHSLFSVVAQGSRPARHPHADWIEEADRHHGAAVQGDLRAAMRHDVRRPAAGADGRAEHDAFAAAEDSAQHRARCGRHTDLQRVFLLRSAGFAHDRGRSKRVRLAVVWKAERIESDGETSAALDLR